MVRRLAVGADPAEFDDRQLHAARSAIDRELLARRLPLTVDEPNGRALLDELEARTGSRGAAHRLLRFMEAWADEAVLSVRGEPTVVEVARSLGISKATSDRRLREYRDALRTEETPTAQIRDLRARWHGQLASIPVRARVLDQRDA